MCAGMALERHHGSMREWRWNSEGYGSDRGERPLAVAAARARKERMKV